MSNRRESDEIDLLKMEIAFLKVEIKTLVRELAELKNEHVIQNSEKQKRTDELFIANKELVFQNEEKQKRTDELFIANKELVFQNEEKQKRADELVIANRHFDTQYEEKRQLAIKLTNAIDELRATEEYLISYIRGLEKLMFMTSHKVRQPIAQIIGISKLIDQSTNYSEDKFKIIIAFIRPCVLALDDFTKELTTFMSDLQNSKKNYAEQHLPEISGSVV